MVHVDLSNVDRFDPFVLLQCGVYVKRTEASSVMSFICDLLDIEADTALKDIKTIMMNNKVVDDPIHEPVDNAITLVLSGAMPGLVGAMLRSDSPYKAMRSTITSAAAAEVTAVSSMIKVKFFNTVLKKYVEPITRHGFWTEEDGA